MQPGRLRYKLPGGLVAHASRVHGMSINAQARRPRHKAHHESLRVVLWDTRLACMQPGRLRYKLPGGLVAHASRVHGMSINAQAGRPRHNARHKSLRVVL